MFWRILKRDNDDHHQEKVNCSWFVGIEKQAVLTEVIMNFGDPRTDEKRCLQVMKKLLYLLNQGQTFTKSEAATVLVAANKLFRFQDLHLRRLVYLIAKDLCPIVGEVDILENSLIVDLDLFNTNFTIRASAIRLLCRSTKGLSSIQTEYYLKSAIMNENHEISIAALVCAQLLLKKDPGIGIIFSEQVGKVAAGSDGLRKFHALCLLFQMQQIEILGVGELARPNIDKIFALMYDDKYPDPLSTCLMLRNIRTQINREASDASGEPHPDYCKYIKRCIFKNTHWFFYKGDMMVAIEGLRSMKQLRNISSSEVEAAKDAVRMRLRNSGDAVDWFGGFRAMHDQDEHEIQSYLEADDVAQVVKSRTEALAADNLRRRGVAVF